MALDFPNSPTTGQIFTSGGVSWRWDGAKWITISPSTNIGTAPPASPTPGTFWWDTNSGQLYVRYDDGTSQQWVVANGPTAGPAGASGVVTQVGKAVIDLSVLSTDTMITLSSMPALFVFETNCLSYNTGAVATVGSPFATADVWTGPGATGIKVGNAVSLANFTSNTPNTPGNVTSVNLASGGVLTNSVTTLYVRLTANTKAGASCTLFVFARVLT